MSPRGDKICRPGATGVGRWEVKPPVAHVWFWKIYIFLFLFFFRTIIVKCQTNNFFLKKVVSLYFLISSNMIKNDEFQNIWCIYIGNDIITYITVIWHITGGRVRWVGCLIKFITYHLSSTCWSKSLSRALTCIMFLQGICYIQILISTYCIHRVDHCSCPALTCVWVE